MVFLSQCHNSIFHFVFSNMFKKHTLFEKQKIYLFLLTAGLKNLNSSMAVEFFFVITPGLVFHLVWSFQTPVHAPTHDLQFSHSNLIIFLRSFFVTSVLLHLLYMCPVCSMLLLLLACFYLFLIFNWNKNLWLVLLFHPSGLW